MESKSFSTSEEPSKEESMVEELDMQQKMEYSEEEIKEQCTIILEVGPNLEYE